MTQNQLIERLKNAGFSLGKWDGYWHRNENPGVCVTILFAPSGYCEMVIHHTGSGESTIDRHSIDEAAQILEELYILDTIN